MTIQKLSFSTLQMFGKAALYIGIAPLFPVLGLMYLIASVEN